MVELILAAVAVIFALWGLTECIHQVHMYFITPDTLYGTRVLVRLQEDTAEQQLHSVGQELRWRGNAYANRVIAIYPPIPLATEHACRKLAAYYGIVLVSAAEISEKLNQYGIF